MEIACGRCSRSYYVPDDVARGRRFRARCSACGDAFVVDVHHGRGAGAALPAASASALPGLAEELAATADLSWLDAAAARADAAAAAEDAAVLGTVRRSRRAAAFAVAAAAGAVLVAGAGLAVWAAGPGAGGTAPPAPPASARDPRLAAEPRSSSGPAGGPAQPHPAAPALARPPPDAPARAGPGAGGTAPPAPPASARDPRLAAEPRSSSGPAGGPAQPHPAAPALARPPPDAPALPPARRPAQRLARGDRRLLDLLARKADAAVVPLVEEDAAAAAGRSLDPAVAGRVVSGARTAFDSCISRALRHRPDLSVARRATLVVSVEPSGTVGRAWVLEEEVDRSDLGACLVQAARRMAFPAFDGEPLDVAVPLSLSAVY